jgi:glucose-1-phosphatase
MLKKYESIIFDLGAVLYDIDVQKTINAFAELGVPHFENVYTLKDQAVLIDLLEKGLISATEFVDGINRIIEGNLDYEEVKNAWNALLIGMPQENIGLLKQLKKEGHKLYLLSNTNIFHFEQINREMREQFELNTLAELFDKAYYSFELGMRKPDMEIYRKLMKEQRLVAGKALFIDDNAANVRGAIAAGIPAVLKTAAQTLEEILGSEL